MLTFQIFEKCYLSHPDPLLKAKYSHSFNNFSYCYPIWPHGDNFHMLANSPRLTSDQTLALYEKKPFPLAFSFWFIRFYTNLSDDYLLFSNSAATQWLTRQNSHPSVFVYHFPLTQDSEKHSSEARASGQYMLMNNAKCSILCHVLVYM